MTTPTQFTPMVHPHSSQRLSDREREILKERGRTFEYGQEAGREVIRCLVCRRTSFLPDDKVYLYCSACNAYHDERLRLWEEEQDRIWAAKQAALSTSEETP